MQETIQLFGIGTQSRSRAITAQRRVNCYMEPRREVEKTGIVLIGRPGMSIFSNSLGSSPTRGMWAVNTLGTPLLFVVQGDSLLALDNGGGASVIGMLTTTSGNVSMVDDGRYLMLVDGTNGYYYDMVSGGALTMITDGNFTTTPTTVTWQDTYFIVTSASPTKQFQLSDNANPATWPAVNINFAGAGGGRLQAGLSDHTIYNLFGDVYTQFYQDTGSPDFPFANIPGSAQQFGLAAPFSLTQFDNSLVGLFQDRTGNVNVSRMNGFALQKISDVDLDLIFQNYISLSDAQGFSFTSEGHAFYVLHFPTENQTWMYDALSKAWSQLEAPDGSAFWGNKAAFFVNRTVVSDRRNGNLYQFDPFIYDEAGDILPMEVISRHIWKDDRYIGISRIQIDIESGVGTATGQGADPQMDLRVSEDGGNTFYSVGFDSMGEIGRYRKRVIWTQLGAARDWVLKLRITDPVKRILTGATAEIMVGSY